MSAVDGTRAGRDLGEVTDQAPWHGEDLRVGDWMDLGTVRVEADEMRSFAQRFDPLPIHLDDANPVFGGVIASGVHTMAMFSSLASRVFIPRLALIAGKGMDTLRLPAPVRPGATLRGAVTINEIAARRGRADVHYQATMTDDDGTVVLSFIGVTVVASRRPH